MNNACKYIIEAEDHTLGNIMRMCDGCVFFVIV